MLLAGPASVQVSSSEQASAVDVEMKDANGDADPKEAGDAPEAGDARKAGGEDQQTSNAAPAKVVGDNEAPAGNAVKLETAVKKEREITVDQDLVHAFRYFDKTGQRCWEPLTAMPNACGLCAGVHQCHT